MKDTIKSSPLAGKSVFLSDNISTLGVETSCSSKMLKGYVPVFNATVAERLEKAAIKIAGKLNIDEFGIAEWSGANTSATTKAIAEAFSSGQTQLALVSDTGGEIRQASAYCGLTGIKPSYGAVSRYGLIANASSLEQIGVIGRNIEDCAALLSIISGSDGKDGTCVMEKPFEFSSVFSSPKIGLPRNYIDSFHDEESKSAIKAAKKIFEEAGAAFEEFDMPLMDYILPIYYTIASAEASSNLSKYDGLKYGHRSTDAKSLSDVYRFSRSEGFGWEVKKRIMLGSLVLSSEYYESYCLKAMQTRSLVINAYKDLFRHFDMIFSPVGDVYNVSANLAGLPSVTLPCGFDGQGMPVDFQSADFQSVGFQLIGSAFSEDTLIGAAQVFQRRTAFHKTQPNESGAAT